MVLIIGGHIRSGTTLLRNFCHSHPNIAVTMEFANFTGLGKSYRGYARQVLRKWWRDRHRSFLVQGENETYWRHVLMSYVFVARYLLELNRHREGGIDIPAIEATLRVLFPEASVVGDKMPYYVYRLDQLVNVDHLIRVIIYRDCRDVVTSTLKMVRTDWRGRPFTRNYETAEKVTKRWVNAIKMMERHADKLHIIRYEHLVRAPEREIQRLAECLGVDPDGFPGRMIQSSSIGKYKNGLSDEELAMVVDIAGPTMARLGYL